MMASDSSLAGQEHLLQFLNDLDADQANQLKSQVDAIDFVQLARLVDAKEAKVDWAALARRAESPPAVQLGADHPKFSAHEAIAAGEQALREGRVGMILVAGGQGTRLGFDKPKGMFPVGPISNRTLFQMHVDRLMAVMKRFDVSIPMYIMTSPATDEATRQFFSDNDQFGLRDDQLQIFCQGTMPAVDAQTGKVLLASKDQIALSPDGHGGLVAALHNGGCLADADSRGIEYFFYAQVDNPLAQLCDPELIGYHMLAKSQMTTQVVKKRFAKEKVGNVVQVDGKVQIIEYSDLPDQIAELTNADGSLKFWAGNIAVHVFDRTFLESVVGDAEGLPFHRANKKVSFINTDGELVEPAEPNAIKFERFVFDLLPIAKSAIVVEGDPAKVFAPVKNADGGEVDTPAHTKEALLALHQSWLIDAGAQLDDGVRVEIHPDWALDAAEVAQKLEAGQRFVADTFLR